MSHLLSCPQCSSLNPNHMSECLNCEATLTSPPQRSSITKGVLKVAGLVAMSMTLTACYGGGDDFRDLDECVDENENGYCDFETCEQPGAGECPPLGGFAGMSSAPEGAEEGGADGAGSQADPERSL